MRTNPDPDDLDLPPLDGEGAEDEEAPGGAHDDDLDTDGAVTDAFDDATAESDPLDEIAVDGAEGGWLLESEDAGIDVGSFDVGIGGEEKLLEDDEPDGRPAEDEIDASEETHHADGGEEGPLAEDEELREEDLPQLDADDDGDVEDDALFDRSAFGADEDLRWDDRAWARVELPADAVREEAEDSGMLAVPGEDPKHGPRDATWRRLEESGKLMAAALVPGESVIVALDGPERPLLVRILEDGVARIIAEIDLHGTDEDVACRVSSLKWDAARGCVVASGTFGTQAFRPA